MADRGLCGLIGPVWPDGGRYGLMGAVMAERGPIWPVGGRYGR